MIIIIYIYIYSILVFCILAIISPSIDGCIHTCLTGGTHPLGLWRTAKQPHVLMLRVGFSCRTCVEIRCCKSLANMDKDANDFFCISTFGQIWGERKL